MGPLGGLKVIEIAGIGPAPFCGMMLADLGADVVRVDRAQNVQGGDPALPPNDLLNRGRRSIGVDLKNPEGAAVVLDLAAGADVLIEGFRPGVAERLGIGPDACHARNPALVYGRMTGWGQDGPYAPAAGHDINYIALAGTLEPLGRSGGPPTPPMNLIGDFGGGGMLLAFGVLAGVYEAQRSGQGQVVDAAMVDGSAALMTMVHSFVAMGMWSEQRGTNMLDTGAHFYDVYETSDGKYVSVGAIEPQFYAALLAGLGLDGDDLGYQHDRTQWPALKERFAAIFKSRTRDEWTAVFDGADACVAPVLTISEAVAHPHNAERGTFTEVAGVTQPAPAPRFDRTPGAISSPPPHAGQHTVEVLREAGLDDDRIAKLRTVGAVA
ncbi:MAG: CaiB/BaiF CoA transferase family protein [Acidimicrobiales bacterium]